MNPIPKSVYSDLLNEIFSSLVKTKSEIKIQAWRRKAESLGSVDLFQHKLMLSILDAYINKNEQAIKKAETALLLTQNNFYRGMAYRVIGNCYAHLGKYQQAMDAYWYAYETTKDPEYFYTFFQAATCYDFYDKRMLEMKSLKKDDQVRFKELLDHLNSEIKKLETHNLNLDLYRDILSEAYKVFFANCSGKVTRFASVADSNVSSILFNPELNLETVGLLNDQMNDSLVNLLDKYEFDEILKYPIIFTSENYFNALHY
ncbi:hypothetical protein [Acinetobacter sp. MB5]|uniref:hypothetical protein n=1 Tax=Acinetobacter sp. MB5 TaxID=2069438 RepID=UPI000DCFE17D|nr:hypothetical protein [Acinetobacter sp. MB5]